MRRNIPSSATKAELMKIWEGFNLTVEPTYTKYAVMGYLGTCRYAYMSHDWLIAQFVWEECIEKISDYLGTDAANIIKGRIEQLYQARGFSPTISPRTPPILKIAA